MINRHKHAQPHGWVLTGRIVGKPYVGITSFLPVRPEPRIDLEIQLLRLVQLALNGAEIVTQRSEEVRHQGSGLTSIGGIRLAELGTHPLFLHAELDPEREEDENENDEHAHLGDGNRHAKETGQNAGVDGVTDERIGTGRDQLVALLNGHGAAPVAAEMLARPDGEQKAGDGDGSSQREGPKANRPKLEISKRSGMRVVERRTIAIRKMKTRRMREAAGSRRWVVLVLAALICQ